MVTIYKISSYLNRKSNSGTFLGGSVAASNGQTDLSNYYTKSQLQTDGQAVIDFYNIKNAYHNDLLGLEGGGVADNSSGESSGMAGEYYHLDEYNYDRLMFLNFSMSLVEDASNVVTLINDEISPGPLKVYGTNAGGIKGWHDIVEASSGNIIVDQYWEISSESNDPYEMLIPVNMTSGIRVGELSIYNDIIQNMNGPTYGFIQMTDYGYTQISTEDNVRITAGMGIIWDSPVLLLGKDTGGTGAVDLRGNDLQNVTTGMHVTLRGGRVILTAGARDGGNLYLYPGDGYDGGVNGDVFFGSGIQGYLKAADSENSEAVCYNPSTGKLGYGALQYFEVTDGIAVYRFGCRDEAFVIDKELTSLGFAGTEDTDWANRQYIHD